MNAKMSFYASDQAAFAVLAEQEIQNIFGSSAGFLTCEDTFPAAVGEAFTDTGERFPMTAIVDALRKDPRHPGTEFWFARVDDRNAEVSPMARYLTVKLDDSTDGYHLRRQYQSTEHRYLATVVPA